MVDQRTVTPEEAAPRRWRPLAVAVTLAALVIGGWLVWQSRPETTQSSAALAEQQPAARAAPRELPPPPAEPTRLAAPAAAPVEPEPAAATEPSSYDRPRHAHPITREHLRMYREDDLLDGAWQALREREFVKARELVATHVSEYPGSKAHMDEGLLLLADCMERPSDETKARARAFYDTKTYSPMRRRLRRLCLELP